MREHSCEDRGLFGAAVNVGKFCLQIDVILISGYLCVDSV